MHKIKFSHKYEKMPLPFFTMDENRTITHLIEVLVTDTKELSTDFITYDTAIAEGGGNQFYKLPKGKILILFLLTSHSGSKELWTTIRRWTPEKEAYYRSIHGQQIEVVVE